MAWTALRARRATLERDVAASRVPPSFRAALRRANVAVIAEVKRRSPSAGPIREDLDPAERAGSVRRPWRRGDLGADRRSLLRGLHRGPQRGRAALPVPVLRKDFILDEVQILEARAAGAAAVLLIVRALGPRLQPLLRYAADLGLDALVEVHTAEELSCGAGGRRRRSSA